VINGKIHTLKF